MYEVYLERAAERDLKKLSEDQFQRILPHLKDLSINAKPRGSRKIKGSTNDWRIRVGDYRIIYEVDEKAKAVMILRIRYRKEAYR